MRRRLLATLRRRRSLHARLDALSAQLAGLQASLDDTRLPEAPTAPASRAATETDAGPSIADVGALLQRVEQVIDEEVRPVLRSLAAEEPQSRRSLAAARGAAGYEQAWDDPRPLVSVTIATRNRPELLVSRSLASLLAQTYEHLDVVVVGDAADPAVGEAVLALGDPRVRWANLTQHTVAHPDPRRHWLVGSTMARNEAHRLARGAWILHFDDDDALRPDAVERLLARARETRAEVVYGGFERRAPDGPSTTFGAFPPTDEDFGWQGALHHAALPFERQLVAATLGVPGDSWLLERMLRAGVRFAMVPGDPVWDYYPSAIWPADGAGDGPGAGRANADA